jgi:GMP synthase-like glutamine amidotransferase
MSIDRWQRRVGRRLLALFALAGGVQFLALPHARGQTAQVGGANEVLLPIKNDRFAADPAGEQPIADWTFESLALEINPDDFSGKLRESPKGDATVLVPNDGQGAILEGTADTARGDLISSPCPLNPFRWIKVGVEYAVESGEPLVFVCLRPTKNRSLVDIEFLPKTGLGEKRKAFVRLHSGSLDGDYSLSFSILGTGSARVLTLKAKEEGDYPRPAKPAVVIDLMHERPATDGPNRWTDIYKLVKVFGFPTIEFISYTEVTAEKLNALDPALILLWPYADQAVNPNRQQIIAATRTAARHGAPLIGVGLGHQILAQAQKDVAMDRVAECGPTRLEVVADDPIFAGLPRLPHFFASESHRSIVREVPPGAEVIATSEKVMTQTFRYSGRRCYTFQANLERDWEVACPEACVIWKNMLRGWGLVPPAEKR